MVKVMRSGEILKISQQDLLKNLMQIMREAARKDDSNDSGLKE